jgi:lipopolysaccharide assembly outer membrane protein LptD (OstA)
VAPAGTEAVRWELTRFTVGHVYDWKNERFGNIKGDLIVQPNGFLRFRGDLAYNPEADVRRELTEGVQTANTDVAVNLERVSGAVGTRYSDPGKISFLQASLAGRLTRHVGLRGSTDWDLRTDQFVEHRVGLDLRFDCWAFTVEYVARHRDEDEFRFTLNLLGLGSPIKTTVGVEGTGSEVRTR